MFPQGSDSTRHMLQESAAGDRDGRSQAAGPGGSLQEIL